MSLSGEEAELRGDGGAAGASACCSRRCRRTVNEVAEVEDVASGLEPSVGAAVLDGFDEAGAYERGYGALGRVLGDVEVGGDGSYRCRGDTTVVSSFEKALEGAPCDGPDASA